MDTAARLDEVSGVIITAPDPDRLVEFTRRLVHDRLCASRNNLQLPHRPLGCRPGS
jgi:hypothetical protein